LPEGDTIRRLANRIDGRFAGQRVQRSAMRDPRLSGHDLAGRVLLGADAYGKHLFVRFDDGRTLHAHLLMTGSFEVGRASTEPEWRRRVELWLEGGRLTGVAVPLLGIIPAAGEREITDQLGPDLCSPAGAPSAEEVATRLVRDPDVALSGALLDQRNAAGWGNLYVNELPFICGVSPFRAVGEIEGIEALVAIGIGLIRINAERGPQNTTGRRLHTDAKWLHGSGRRPCPVCGGRLSYRNADRTPWERSITWCPKCQPESAATVDVARATRMLSLHPAAKLAYFPR
jgi:endonuclease VIII